MTKILVMIPAGEVYDHDCVRWYKAHNIQRNINRYHNIGDAFVHDSSLKLLNFEAVDVLMISTAKPEDIERYNAEFDYVFLRGSNYLHPDMDWMQAIATLEKLRIPVIAFGIGAQAQADGKPELKDDTKRVLALIAERCTTIGVRGSYTAEVLAGLGIKNTRVIGCPTLYRHNNPDLRIDLKPLDQVRRIAFSLRREVSAAYACDVQHYLELHRSMMIELAGRFQLTVLAQGEIEEKKIFQGTPEQAADAIATLTERGWFKGPDDPLLKLYRERLFYSDIVADYDAITRRRDLVLGFRLHGNMMALANGVPSICFTYDSRTTEFVQAFDIPSYDIDGGKKFVLEEYWDQARFDKFNSAYRRGYSDLRQFLDENRISHRLVPAAPAVKPVAVPGTAAIATAPPAPAPEAKPVPAAAAPTSQAA